MKEIITKLQNKKVLNYKELDQIFTGYLNDKVTDKEMTIILKHICKYELTKQEIFDLTDIFIKSGESLPKNEDFFDKHSTGGVGDKTTLIVLPILASLGIKLSKMSGKALGYTGGTIDKLNSVNVKTELTKKEFYESIEKTNMVISSQTNNLCPLDKKVYALRDITGTTKSLSLIAVSIMSKKIASGAGKILIDIKVGKGALLETEKKARKLAELMIEIGKKYDRKVICMLTKMDNPLGSNIGNKIEILEVKEILENKKENKLKDLCINMASIIYSEKTNQNLKTSRQLVIETVENGMAYKTFEKYIENVKGKITESLPKPHILYSNKTGYVKSINSKIIGTYSMKLGAGRVNKNDKIDYNAGIILTKQVGNYVKKGEELCKLYGKEIDYNQIYKAYKIGIIKPKQENIIIDVIGYKK